jgi:hypothetical protein
VDEETCNCRMKMEVPKNLGGPVLVYPWWRVLSWSACQVLFQGLIPLIMSTPVHVNSSSASSTVDMGVIRPGEDEDTRRIDFSGGKGLQKWMKR